MSKPYYPALATITASRWALFKARLFGYRTQRDEDGYIITCLRYKGITYVVGVEAL